MTMTHDQTDDDDYSTSVSVEQVLRDTGNRPYLIVLAGPNVGEMYPVEGAESLVGRGTNASLHLDDDGISRRHVRIVVKGKDVRIEDLGSANGTFINGERVSAAPLRDGDKIQLGSTTNLEVHLPRQAGGVLPAPDVRSCAARRLDQGLQQEAPARLAHRRVCLRTSPQDAAFPRDARHRPLQERERHLRAPRWRYVLSKLAATVQAVLRTEEVFGRYGGEEFVVLCRDTDRRAAGIVAERIRATVEQMSFAYEGRAIPVTVSLGIAEYPAVAFNGHG